MLDARARVLAAVVSVAVGLVGAASTFGQAQDLAAARQQYELKLKQVPPDAGADAHYDLAKWCLKSGLRPEALKHARLAHQKAPEDLRPKYLIYLLSGAGEPGVSTPEGSGTSDTGGPTVLPTPGGRRPVTISAEQVQALVQEEGIDRIRAFREIQRALVQRCATPKCHGAVGTGAKWVLALQGPTNERMLAENFRTVSKYFNRENPEASPFLKKPLLGPAADHPEKVLRGKTDPVYQRLLKYIGSLKTQIDKLWGKTSQGT